MEDKDKRRTSLNVTINGICMDDDGTEHIINQTFAAVNAVNLDLFTWLPDEQLQQDHVCMGGFNGMMWEKAMLRIMETVGLDTFVQAMKEAIIDIVGDADDEDDGQEAATAQKDVT